MLKVSQSIYLYKATLERVIDGDTIVAMLDLGFKITWVQHIRFINVDVYETRGVHADPIGQVATEFVRNLFQRYGPEFYLRSDHDTVAVYNRVAGWPFLEMEPGRFIDLIATLKASGFDKVIKGPIQEHLVIIEAADISLVQPAT